MKKIHDFKCTHCFNVFEAWVEDDIKKGDCPGCGNESNRLASAPKVKGNTTGKSPSFSGGKL